MRSGLASSLKAAGGARPGSGKSSEYYGFSPALGRPRSVCRRKANIYRALTNGGLWNPLRVLVDAPPEGSHRVMSAEAVFIIADILSDSAGRATTFGLDSPLATHYLDRREDRPPQEPAGQLTHWLQPLLHRGDRCGKFRRRRHAWRIRYRRHGTGWLAIMNALHEAEPSIAPPAPGGLISRGIRFISGFGSRQEARRRADAHAERRRTSDRPPALKPGCPRSGNHVLKLKPAGRGGGLDTVRFQAEARP